MFQFTTVNKNVTSFRLKSIKGQYEGFVPRFFVYITYRLQYDICMHPLGGAEH